jgi:mannose-1-phosphate guanylyltransferase
VARFVEKPGPSAAAELHQQGALWNTLIVVAKGRSLWAMLARHLPGAVATVEPLCQEGLLAAETLEETYRDLPSADLSSDVLQVANGLQVVALEDAGWSDYGTPEGLLRCLDARARAAVLASLDHAQ